MKTRFHQLVDAIAAELANPSDPAVLLASYAELRQIDKDPPAIIAARNALRQQQLKEARLAEEAQRVKEAQIEAEKRAAAAAEAQRIRDEAERARREMVAAQHRVVQQLRLDFNEALSGKDLDQASFLAASFRQAALQAGLLEAVGGFEERANFFANVAEKIEKLEQAVAEEAEVQKEQEVLKARAKLALHGPVVSNGHSAESGCRRGGKTERDIASGARAQWEKNRRDRKLAAVSTSGSNGKKKGGKKNKK